MFKPSVNGFQFSNNRWPEEPDLVLDVPLLGKIPLGNAAQGLCGGMTYLACDYYLRGELPPSLTDNPPAESDLFKKIVGRFIDSVDIPMGLLKAYGWMAYPFDLAQRTWQMELPALRLKTYHDVPVPLTVILLQSLNPLDGCHNHQVLAYDTREEQDKLRVFVYDPNCPGDDQASFLCGPTGISSAYYPQVRGFYCNDYVSA